MNTDDAGTNVFWVFKVYVFIGTPVKICRYYTTIWEEERLHANSWNPIMVECLNVWSIQQAWRGVPHSLGLPGRKTLTRRVLKGLGIGPAVNPPIVRICIRAQVTHNIISWTEQDRKLMARVSMPLNLQFWQTKVTVCDTSHVPNMVELCLKVAPHFFPNWSSSSPKLQCVKLSRLTVTISSSILAWTWRSIQKGPNCFTLAYCICKERSKRLPMKGVFYFLRLSPHPWFLNSKT